MLSDKEHHLKIKKILSAYGFTRGETLAQDIPGHIIYNRVVDKKTGIEGWFTYINEKRYTIVAYPSNTSQRVILKALPKIDALVKLYYPKSPRLPYASLTNQRAFYKARNRWIRERYEHYRKKGHNDKYSYESIQRELEIRGSALSKKMPEWARPNDGYHKRDPFILSVKAIRKVVKGQ